jgi:hypothetical protein
VQVILGRGDKDAVLIGAEVDPVDPVERVVMGMHCEDAAEDAN